MKIKDYLDPEAILLQLDAESSEEVIRELGGLLLGLGYVKENFVEATIERERTMPTGLPLGGDFNAAIPHVDIEYVNKSALGLATLTQPVVFYNMVENEVEVPCRLVIMLALDQPKSQVEMLQSVAEVLQDPARIEKLMAAESVEEIYAALE